jgi:hypothetical protein
MQEWERAVRANNEAVRKMKDAEKRAPLENAVAYLVVAGAISFVGFIGLIVLAGVSTGITNGPDGRSGSEERIIPGLEITGSEYQRRQNCLIFGC